MIARLGLRARIVGFLVGVLGLSWLAGALFVTPRVESSIRDEQEQRIDQMAGTVGRDIDDRLSTALRELEVLAEQPVIRSMDRARIDAALSEHDAVSQSFLYFTVLDREGRVLSRPSKPERVGADRSGRSYFRRALETGRAGVVEPARSTAGNRSLVATVPITDGRGAIVGVLAGSLGLADRNQSLYAPITEPVITAWPVQLFLVSDAGSVIAGSTALGEPTDEGVSRAPVFEDRGEVAATVSDLGKRWVVATHRVDPPGWTVVARVPEALVAQRTAEVSRPYTVAALVTTLITIALALLLVGFLLRPLARLARALTEYGRTEKLASLPETGPRELDEVARAFNRMLEERQSLELQLRQSQKLQTLGTFAGGIAHDFNNLLTPILMGANALASHHEHSTGLGSVAADVELSARRAKDLVARLLGFSRQAKPQRIAIDLANEIGEALRLASFHVPASVVVESALEPGCEAMGDPIQVQQVALNLVTNAVDAMGSAGGTLSVRLRKSEDGARALLEVSDTGQGMDAETLERVFDPFYTTKGAAEGTGLGLAIVLGIVRENGATVRAESEPGVGTTFVVDWPLGDAETVDVQPVADGASPPVGERHRLLVVDDEPAVARSLGTILRTVGYEVTIETDSRAALERVVDGDDAFDLIVTDNGMPGLTGLELAKRVLEERTDQRFLVVTGVLDAEVTERFRDLGIEHVAAKPLSATELERLVRQALDQGYRRR